MPYKDKEEARKYRAAYYLKHKERELECMRKWKKDNPDYHNKYNVVRKKEDPLYNMTCRIRTRTCKAISRNGFLKRKATANMLGCSYEEFVSHLESTFTEGMTWELRDKWHIDHIIPLSSAKTLEELEDLAHYTNTQALWAEDNLKKGDKW